MQPRAPIFSSKWPLVLAALGVWSSSCSFAIDLLVYNTNNSGPGSLRQVISDNNALSGGNTIIFSNVVTGTITLTNGQLLISKDLTLIGPGANVLAVSGNNASRVFYVTNAATVSISGLTVSGGSATNNFSSGAGIFNDLSTLTISNCIFSGNSAYRGGAIYNNHATLTISNCIISGNSADYGGGGIYNNAEGIPGGTATLTLIRSTLSGNSGGFGGAVYSTGNQTAPAIVTITNCTLSNNSAASGGAIFSDGQNSIAKVTLIGSTLSGNSATYGDNIWNQGSGGIAVVEFADSILNAGASGTNIFNFPPATITSDGYNICSDNGGGFFINVADQINANPNLGPLQDNGGPTPTMTPLAGSPAIDQGKSFGLTTDQRGQPRTFDNPAIPNASAGDGSDIGAVEVQPPATFVVFNANDSGSGSLRQAISDNNATAGGNAVIFSNVVTGTITLTSGQLLISKDLSLIGPGASVLAVNGNHASRVFYVTNAAAVSISGLTISNGLATGSFPNNLGGGIFNDHSTLTIRNCTISSNSASGAGGGIVNFGESSGSATLAVTASTISGNSAPSGGGIYNDGVGASGSATATVTASTFSGNSASGGSGYGGGIYNFGAFSGGATATLKVIASTFSSNSASGYGGSIYNQGPTGATLEIGDTILQAGASGANIFNSGPLTSDGYNLSSDDGGGFLTSATDQINTDPKLGPLQNNGGPTFTHALLSNSPAIDKGISFGVTTDQRGAPRPFDFSSIANASGGDGSDIGAFELGRPTLNLQKFNNNAVLSWQSYYGDFTLQSVTNVIASNSWATVAGMPAVVANQYVLTNGPISGNRFYRLKGN